VGVALRSAARTACHAEGGQLGVLEGDVLHAPEEAEVLGVRARPAPLYIMDAESVQPRGQTDLVFHGKGDAFALRPITKCRVVNLDQTAHSGASGVTLGASRHDRLRGWTVSRLGDSAILLHHGVNE